MPEKLRLWLEKNQGWIAIVLIVSGIIFYFSQSVYFAHTIPSTVWDEGMYVYKSHLFASGEYTPFEDSGPWTNQMPFAYFLAGWPQVVFGAGFRTGRYLAVALGLLGLTGLALAANRVSGRWGAAAVVWVVALNTGWVQSYSQLFSQGMVSFLFAWMLFFIANKRENLAEITAAAFLAGLAGMVRINVLPMVFLLVIYVFWQYGRQAGLSALAGGLAPVVLLHQFYWPDIFKIWAYWIPEGLFPAIAAFRSPWREIFVPADFSWLPVRAWLSDPDHLAWQGVSALVDALRVNFLSWFGMLCALVLLPRRGAWRSDHHRKLTFFLLGSYLVMLVIHFWAALGGKSCQFVCLPGYFLFFNWLGLIGILASVTEWRKTLGRWRTVFLLLVAFAALVGFEYRYQDNFRDLRSGLVLDVFGFEREMLEDRQNLSADEVGPIWEWLEASLGFDYFRWLRFIWLSDFVSRVLWWLLPAVFVIGIPWIAYQALKRFGGPRPVFTDFGLAVVLAFGGVYASAPLLAQPLQVETCGVDVIEQVEQIGADLNAKIPAKETLI